MIDINRSGDVAKISNLFQVQIIDHRGFNFGRRREGSKQVREQDMATEWGHGVLSNIHYLSDNGNGNP